MALVFVLFAVGKVAVAASVPVVITNERIERVDGGGVKVYWNTNIPTTGRIVYGKESVLVPGIPLGFEGYQKGTVKTHGPLVFEHSITLFGIEDVQTYFFRPVSKAGDQISFGRELSLIGNSTFQRVDLPVVSATPREGCLYMSSYLHVGANDNAGDVIKLQNFLNQFEGERLSVTGVFGNDTFDAVKRFQEKYAGDILHPWGYDSGTGHVYILTQKKINEMSCRTFFPLSHSQLQEIGDFNIKNSQKAVSILPSEVENKPQEVVIEVLPISVPIVATTTKPVIMPIKDISTSTSAMSDSVVNMINTDNSFDNKKQIATLGDVANSSSQGLFSLAISMPQNSADLLKNAIYFILIIIFIYIISNIIAHTDNPGISINTIRSRKIIFYFFGVILAILVAILFKFYVLILPLVLISIALAIVWVTYFYGKNTTDLIIPHSISK